MPTELAIITDPEQITPDWLTGTLREQGTLARGKVIDIGRRANDAFNSTVVHLDVGYSDDAPDAAPKRLVVKLNARNEGQLEALFYQLAAHLLPPPPSLVRCYAALYDPIGGDSCCVLEDLSETHRTPVTRAQVLAGEGVPSDAELDSIVDAVGRFHAYWWEHPELGKTPEVTEVRPWYRDLPYYEKHVERRRSEWTQFIASEGDGFPADLRDLYETLLAALPALWERYLAHRVTAFRHVTLTNGDCYFAQTLCPKEPASGETYLIDFQDVSANFAAYDLVYLFATFWSPRQRRENGREERLLHRYHEVLHANGVNSYSWDELMTDYRLMVLMMLFDPVWNQTSGSRREYWWPKLQCLTDNYRDLRCDDLLP